MEVYGSASFPLMSTQELIDWAKVCHPNVSIHAYDSYDSTWRKFMKHIASNNRSVCLVFYIKDHYLYPIQDDRLKHQFQPPQDSYYNICYLNKTRRYVTQECCNRFTENLEYYEIDFKYQGHREKFTLSYDYGISADVSIFETGFGRFRTVLIYALFGLNLGNPV